MSGLEHTGKVRRYFLDKLNKTGSRRASPRAERDKRKDIITQ